MGVIVIQFAEINPYVRFARYMNLDEYSRFDDVVPLDARLFYVVDGFGKIKVKNTEYEMKENSLIIFNSGTPYKIITPPNMAKYIAINFDYTKNFSDLVTPIAPVDKNIFKSEMLVDENNFSDTAPLSEVLYLRQIPAVKKKLTSIIRECTQKLLYYEIKAGHMLAECIAESVRAFEIGDIGTEKENDIISYIHSNYNKDISNKLIGNAFGYHPNYVSSLVKKLTGMPIHQYILHIRLMNAVNLLENTNLSCDEIALSCGFCDLAYFSKYFKNHFGISPSKYRSI